MLTGALALQTLASVLWAFVRLHHQPSHNVLQLTSHWVAAFLEHPEVPPLMHACTHSPAPLFSPPGTGPILCSLQQRGPA